MTVEEYNVLSGRIIGAAMEVHKILGPGLLEGVYESCFLAELRSRGLRVEQQVAVPIVYKGQQVGTPLKLDIIVEDSVVVELKTVSEILDIHSAQLLSYLKLADKKLGLIINFNCIQLKEGIKRVANGL